MQNLEFITALRGKTRASARREHVHRPRCRKVAPAIVIANPRVTSAQQARASGKPVMFLFGNIHPPESEAAEALQMVARDLAAGTRQHLLQNQIVIIAPVFNVDGTDTFVAQNGSLGSETPHIFGMRENAAGFDLNRDAVKLETVEASGHVPPAERLGSGAAARRSPDEPRQSRLRQHVRHHHRARRGPGSARLHPRHAVSCRSRHGAEGVRPGSLHPCALRPRRRLAADHVEP